MAQCPTTFRSGPLESGDPLAEEWQLSQAGWRPQPRVGTPYSASAATPPFPPPPPRHYRGGSTLPLLHPGAAMTSRHPVTAQTAATALAVFAALTVLLAAAVQPRPATAQTTEQNDSSAAEARRNNSLPLIATRTLDFTTDEGTWISLDLSPDGETIVFELLGDLYTLPVTGGDATRITGGQAYDMQPRYSPDGSMLVFVSDRDGSENIWVSSADGSGARQLTDTERESYMSPVWAPDGEYVVANKGTQLWLYHRGRGLGRPDDRAPGGRRARPARPPGRGLRRRPPLPLAERARRGSRAGSRPSAGRASSTPVMPSSSAPTTPPDGARRERWDPSSSRFSTARQGASTCARTNTRAPSGRSRAPTGAGWCTRPAGTRARRSSCSTWRPVATPGWSWTCSATTRRAAACATGTSTRARPSPRTRAR